MIKKGLNKKFNADKATVAIRRQWNDWRQADVPFNKISGLRWSNVSGGVQSRSPHTMIYGYVWCTDVDGEISHSCAHAEAPHSIKVCIVKKDNSPEVYRALLKIVGEKPE